MQHIHMKVPDQGFLSERHHVISTSNESTLLLVDLCRKNEKKKENSVQQQNKMAWAQEELKVMFPPTK